MNSLQDAACKDDGGAADRGPVGAGLRGGIDLRLVAHLMLSHWKPWERLKKQDRKGKRGDWLAGIAGEAAWMPQAHRRVISPQLPAGRMLLVAEKGHDANICRPSGPGRAAE